MYSSVALIFRLPQTSPAKAAFLCWAQLSRLSSLVYEAAWVGIARKIAKSQLYICLAADVLSGNKYSCNVVIHNPISSV